MLKRLLTGLVLAPLVLALIVYSENTYFAVLLCVLFGFTFHEGMPLIPLKTRWLQLALILANTLFLAVIYYFSQGLVLLYTALCLWLFIMFIVISFPAFSDLWGHRPLVFGFLWVVIGGAFSALTVLKGTDKGHEYLIYLMFLVWAADSGAYFFGKALGRHKMIVHVSPGKTLEGLLGGILTVLFIAAVGDFYFAHHHRMAWYLLAVAVFISSVFGDLFISMLKRRAHVKDTGSILPGHGGLLDRLDSLLSASVFFVLGAKWLQII